MNKLLLVFAHPDDESLAVSGTIVKYSKRNWTIDLICATPGERGAGNPGDWGKELAQIRQKELLLAARVLGIATVTFLGFRDGLLSKEPPGEIEEPTYRKMLELVPSIVITFDPSGMTNHPDHKKISLSTTFAFQKYAKEFEKRFPHNNVPKLYYSCLPQTLVSYLQRKHSIPLESFGKRWVGVDDQRITTVIDIKRFMSTKLKAINVHKSQKDLSGPLRTAVTLKNSPFLMHEYFLLRMVGTLEAFVGKNDRIANRL